MNINNYEAFEDYQNKPLWMCYTKAKQPINPHFKRLGSISQPKTQGTIAECLSRLGQTASVKGDDYLYIQELILGAGIVVGGGLCCIDLDDVIDEDGTIDKEAEEIIATMNSYSEYSLSKRGVHIFFTCDTDFPRTIVYMDEGKTRHRELYTKNHFIAVTGDVLPGHETIQPRTQQAIEVYRTYYKPYELIGYGSSAPRMVSPGRARNRVEDPGEKLEAIEAIENHDWKWFQKALQEPPKEFNSSEDFFEFLYRYSLSDFFGVQERKGFCCPFHDDGKPSASVYQAGADKGAIWLFHCFSEGMTLTVKDLVRKAGGFETDVEALEFLKLCLNVRISDNEWAVLQKGTIQAIKDFMNGDFDLLCPVASKNLRYAKGIYLSLLSYAEGHIIPTTKATTSNVVFFVSMEDLTRKAKKGSVAAVSQWLKCIQYHGLLKALPDRELSKENLDKAKAIAKRNGRTKRVSFFELSPLDPVRIEGQAVKWKEYGYTRKGISYEMFARAEGNVVADSLYAQRLEGSREERIRTVSHLANEQAEIRHEKLRYIAYNLLDEQGYFTLNQLVERFGNKEWGLTQAKRSIADICNSDNLVRRKATKALKEELGIDSTGYPYIFTRAG